MFTAFSLLLPSHAFSINYMYPKLEFFVVTHSDDHTQNIIQVKYNTITISIFRVKIYVPLTHFTIINHMHAPKTGKFQVNVKYNMFTVQ